MYNINLNLFIVSVDIKTEKRYILSTCKDDICIPQIPLPVLSKDRIKIFLSEYIRCIIPMHILGISPQIISLHSSNLVNTYKKRGLEINENDIQTIYGCLTDYIQPVKEDFFWVEFNYQLPNDYSSNIFEVCQSLR